MDIFYNLLKKGLFADSNNVRTERTYLINYNCNDFRVITNKYQLKAGYELENKAPNKSGVTDKEEVERISRVRTKSRIRELAFCNDFEYFGTITINGYFCNRFELDDCQNELKKYLKMIKRKNSNLKYLIITEEHKDGAFHFHGLFSGLDLQYNDFGYLYSPIFNNLGYNSFSRIDNYSKCCNYITKYITKKCVKNSHNQIFIRSKGLKVATKEEIDISKLDIEFKFENDFTKIYDFSLDNLSENDKILVTNLLGK